MGQIVRKRKKGRPSKADLAARRVAEEAEDSRRRRRRHQPRRHSHHRRRPLTADEEEGERRDLRRSLRRRSGIRYNLIDYDEDYWEDDGDDLGLLEEEEEEEEEDDEEEEQEPAEDEEEDEDERREKKLKLVVKLPNKKSSCSGRNGRNGAILNGGDSASRTRRTVESEDEEENEEEEEEEERGEEEDGVEKEEEEDYWLLKKRKVIRGKDYDEDNYDDDEEIGRRKDESNRSDSVPGTPNGASDRTPLPEKKQLELILDKLQKKDTYGVYAEPVDPEELPDYHDIIEHPMDFATVRKQLANGEYFSLEQFESDVYLICSNAMQYNAPETIYHKQARAIKELAEKKFQRVRSHMEQMAKEAKSEQKMKPAPIVINKQAKKPQSRGIQEPVGSDFSAGATLASGDAPITTATAGPTSNCERSRNNEGLMEGISSLTDSNTEKAEDLQSGKGQASRLGRKWFMVDENRRGTYDESNQPIDRSDSVFATFEGEQKLLIPVGLYGEHSYTQSFARFAASLGPVAWSMASERIEQALPPGFKFGRGWVGEFEPLPTPILYTLSQVGKEHPFDRNLQKPDLPVKGLNNPTTIISSNDCQDNGSILNGKPSLLINSGVTGPSTASITVRQQIPFLGKLQNVAAPVKSNEPLPLVAGDVCVNIEPVSDGKPSLLPDSVGIKPTTSLTGAFVPQQNPFVRKLWNGSVPGEGHKPVQTQVIFKERLDNGHILEGKPSLLPHSRGSRPATPSSGIGKQMNLFSKNNSGPENMIVKRVELSSPTAMTNQNTNGSLQKQFHCGTETATPRQVDKSPRNLSFPQSLPFRPPPPVTSGGAIPGVVFPDEKNSMLNVYVDINQPASSSGASSSQAIGVTKMAFLPRQDQGLSDPVQVMRTLTGNAQKQQNNKCNSLISPMQIRPSIPSPRGGGSTSGAAKAAASAWMSVGAGGVKPTTENLSTHTRSQISAESLHNTVKELRPQMPQSHGETHLSSAMHIQSENNFFPFQAFVSQPVKLTNEAQVQQQRPMLLPQFMINDPSRVQHVQSSWRGISPHMTQQRQKPDTLPPDLNVAFQSTVDSQQPDLALQL